MNTAVSILVTVLLVAGGIGTYHVLTHEGAGAQTAAGPIDLGSRDLAGLEDRLDQLEGRGPVLQGSTAPSELYDRIRELEARLASIEKAGPARVTAGETVPVEAPPAVAAAAGNEVVNLPDGAVSPLTKAQEKRVADLVQETMRSRMQRAGSDRMDRTLQQLGIELNDDQRTKLDTAMSEHFTKVRDLFRSGRDSGQSREELAQQAQALNQELTQKVSGFVPIQDAEAIVNSLTQMGGGRRGGPPNRGR